MKSQRTIASTLDYYLVIQVAMNLRLKSSDIILLSKLQSFASRVREAIIYIFSCAA